MTLELLTKGDLEDDDEEDERTWQDGREAIEDDGVLEAVELGTSSNAWSSADEMLAVVGCRVEGGGSDCEMAVSFREASRK